MRRAAGTDCVTVHRRAGGEHEQRRIAQGPRRLHEVPGAVHVDLAGQSRIAVRAAKRCAKYRSRGSIALNRRGDGVRVGEIGVCGISSPVCDVAARSTAAAAERSLRVHRDHRPAAAGKSVQRLPSWPKHLSQGGFATHARPAPTVARCHGSRRNPHREQCINISSRNPVSVDVLISPSPSTFGRFRDSALAR